MNQEKTIFQKIIEGEIPSHKIYEDDKCIVILDKFPNTKGQSLVISKEPIDYAFDIDDETYLHMLAIAKKIVKATDKALNPTRTCLVIEGFEVPHAHIKLFPVYDLPLNIGSGPEIDDEEAEKITVDIKNNLNLEE